MRYTLSMKIDSDVIGLPGTYATAAVESSDGTVSRGRGWLDKPVPTNDNIGELFHEMLDEFFPKKSAPDNTEIEVKTRRKKNAQADS